MYSQDPYNWETNLQPFKLAKPIQFGVASWAEGMMSGIFGASYGAGYNTNYSGFIDEIYQQGLIRDKDFSIALGSVGKDYGKFQAGSRKNKTTTNQQHQARWCSAALICPSSRDLFMASRSRASIRGRKTGSTGKYLSADS